MQAPLKAHLVKGNDLTQTEINSNSYRNLGREVNSSTCSGDGPTFRGARFSGAVGDLENWKSGDLVSLPAETPMPRSDCDELAEIQRLASITNEAFRDAIFHSTSTSGSPVACTQMGVPGFGSWFAKNASNLTECRPNNNNYLNCSSYKTTSKGLRAQAENFVAIHCVMLDDVGTKVPLERLAGIQCSWRLETSPGNYQVGFILEQPLEDVKKATALSRAIRDTSLADPDATGIYRWMRMPVAINGKEKHRQSYGAFRCRLIEWNPEVRYDHASLVRCLGLESALAESLGHQEPRKAVNHVARDTCESRLMTVETLLESIDPDTGYAEWIQVLQAIHYESDGSEEGLEIADAWSSKGAKYKGRRELEAKWSSFKAPNGAPITMGTLVMLARTASGDFSIRNSEDAECFEPCDMVEIVTAVNSGGGVASVSSVPSHQLQRFSLKGQSDSLFDLAGSEVKVLGDIALKGQATLIYAAPNTGKTLLTMHLITEAIEQQRIDPSKVFYLNLDDNTAGLASKTRLGEQYGFHVLADGYNGFKVSMVQDLLDSMSQSNTVDGAIMIVDTYKKIVDPMNKKDGREMNAALRRFVLKGGTVVALAHTNKNPGPDGKKVYAGTSDALEDFDCAYMLDQVGTEGAFKVVQFENIKRRGSVAQTAGYSYLNASATSYEDRLISVEKKDESEIDVIKEEAVRVADSVMINQIKAAIRGGFNTKMKLLAAVKEDTKASRRDVEAVLGRHTGSDPELHLWMVNVGKHGRNTYQILDDLATNASAGPQTF